MRPLLDMIELSVKVPRGEAGFWSIILDLDNKGPWTRKQVSDLTNVSHNIVNDYIKRLRLAGFVKLVDKFHHGRMGQNVDPVHVYRLVKRPKRAPRIRKDGTIIAETAKEQLWRAMRMLKEFNVHELPQHCTGDVADDTAKSYAWSLAGAGVLAGKAPHYRLVRDLGSAAPKILTTKMVFDPNKNVVVGNPVAREVSP
jgi:hypothetical protein